MQGFFSTEELQSTQNSAKKIAGCGACKLYKDCNTPRMKPTGKGEKGILIIAEAPGEAEDRKGIQLIGDAGQELRRKLKWQGIDLDRDCRKTNAVCCRPPGNKTPTNQQITCCRPNVWREIAEYKPNLIILLGLPAVKSFLGDRMSDVTSIAKWRGWTIPDRVAHSWVVPTYHPSYLLRMQKKNPAVERVFEIDLQTAMKYIDKPVYRPIMGEESCVEILTDQRHLTDRLNKILEYEELVAFDYETTGLKPHRVGHQIVSCSLALNGTRAISFDIPVKGTKAWGLLKRILQADHIGKMAHNIKFEDQWSEIRFPCKVKNWVWDSMLAAHVLDNREGITGLKFQAYVRFGMPDYSSHLDRFLKSGKKDKNATNKIFDAPRQDLLLYNGIDSLLEYRLAELQMKELNYVP